MTRKYLKTDATTLRSTKRNRINLSNLVFFILQQNPERKFTTTEILEIVQAEGLKTQIESVSTLCTRYSGNDKSIIKRLRKDFFIRKYDRKNKRNTYQFNENHTAPYSGRSSKSMFKVTYNNVNRVELVRG